MRENIAKELLTPRPLTLPFAAVIFDMDGTLIASTNADYLAWKMLFSEHKKTLTYEQYTPMMGIRSREVMETQLDLHDEDLEEALRRKLLYFKRVMLIHGIDMTPYADSFLKSLREYPIKLALATSSRKRKMEMVMQEVGLIDHFDVFITAEDVAHGKPAPDIFIKAAEKLQTPPEKCIVIEDARAGVRAAKNANMKCVAITTTHPADLLHEADLVIDSFQDIELEKLSKIMSE
jgi:beta-phosphoglucomutase